MNKDVKRIYSWVAASEKAELYVIPQAHILDSKDHNSVIRSKIMTSLAQLYNDYTNLLLKKYRSDFGFSDLGMVYNKN